MSNQDPPCTARGELNRIAWGWRLLHPKDPRHKHSSTCDLAAGHKGPHNCPKWGRTWATREDRVRIHKEWLVDLDAQGSAMWHYLTTERLTTERTTGRLCV